MKLVMTTCALAFAFAVSMSAQDTKATTKTTVKADDAKTILMTGCLQQGATPGSFALLGSITKGGDDLKSKTVVKTDVDKDKTEVNTKETTEIEHGNRAAVGTSYTTYELTPKDGVNLIPHVGHKVEIAAVMLEPAKGSDKDATITIKEDTKVEIENAPDVRSQTKTKAELPRGPQARLMALSVKHVSPTCTP